MHEPPAYLMVANVISHYLKVKRTKGNENVQYEIWSSQGSECQFFLYVLEVLDASILKVKKGRNFDDHQTKWHHILKGWSLTMFSLTAVENVRELLAKMYGLLHSMDVVAYYNKQAICDSSSFLVHYTSNLTNATWITADFLIMCFSFNFFLNWSSLLLPFNNIEDSVVNPCLLQVFKQVIIIQPTKIFVFFKWNVNRYMRTAEVVLSVK